ncbi:MAG: site-specific integrase [Oscillospiraceae bacterium]|jgi:integrase|nr:site-specific integrase [Oscillospiraceae bacterium]
MEEKSKPGRHKKYQRQTGSKLFQKVLELPRNKDGSRNRKFFYGATNAEAEERRDAYKKKLKGGIVLDEQDMTVQQWGETWFATYKSGLAYNTRQIYMNVLENKIYPQIGIMRMKDVRHAHLQGLLGNYAGTSKSAIGKLHNTIGQMFSLAVTNRIIENNPAEGLTNPDGTAGTHRALEKWEINLIAENWHRHRAGIWIMLMLFAGLRRGEMIALKWSNVDLASEKLTVAEAAHIESNRAVDGGTKTAAGMRVIPIVPPLMTALRSEKEKSPHGELVCTMSNLEQLTLTGLRRGLDGFILVLNKMHHGLPPELTPGKAPVRLTKEEREGKTKEELTALLKEKRKEWDKVHFTPHDLRHTFSTMLYDAGVDMKSAQYLLGHRDIRMTLQLYTHLSDEKKNEASETMKNFFVQWSGGSEEEEPAT